MSRDESTGQVHSLPERDGGEALTVRQRRVLEVIRNSIDRRGYPPSMREIGDAVGLHSPSSVSHQLNVLERKGFLCLGTKETLKFTRHADAFTEFVREQRIYQRR